MRCIIGFLVLATVFGPPALSQNDTQTEWTPLTGITSEVTPAVTSNPLAGDGELILAAVSFSGIVGTTHGPAPGAFAAWEVRGPQPCSPQPCVDSAFYADPQTAPIFGLDGNTLYLFARGSDDNVHFIRKVGANPWEPDWTQLTTTGRVQGRFSLAMTRQASGGGIEFALLYTAPDGVEFRQFDSSLNPIGVPWLWPGAYEGTLGTDGENQILAVVRDGSNVLDIDTKIRPWTSAWQPSVEIYATGDLGQFHEISEVVFLNHAFHATYAREYLCDDVTFTYCDRLEHVMVPLNGAYPQARIIQFYVAVGGQRAIPELAAYRDKLVVAYTMPDGFVRYSRWDTADPTLPWVGSDVISNSAQTTMRPGLGVLNHRPVMTTMDQGLPNFGDDLFAVISEDDFPPGVRYINFSRAAFTLEFDRQVAVYDSNGNTPLCSGVPADATLVPDAFADGRIVLSEVGYDLWALPNWFMSHAVQDAAELGCLAGNPSGRFDPPCATTRYPVILKPGGGIFVCDGAWVNWGSNYLGVWEEFGHSISAGTMGFDDNNGSPPDATNAALSGLALTELVAGYNLFGEQVNGGQTCNLGSDPAGPNAGRCRGFTGHGVNYDVGSRQHSLIYLVFYYLNDGDLLRDLIQRDLLVGVDLLQRKYDWVRTELFLGVEFRDGNALRNPWDVDCVTTVPLTCGSTYSATTLGRPNDVEGYACNAYTYNGPEVTHVVTAAADASVTVTLSGLGADLDLMLAGGVGFGCDSAACTSSSTVGGAGDEAVFFAATAGEPYYLSVDGFAGAASDYTLTVTCSGDSPGSVPPSMPSTQLQVTKGETGSDLFLYWGDSCLAAATDYAVYEGDIGLWYNHVPKTCSTSGFNSTSVIPGGGSHYYLVVPQSGLAEGSYGLDSNGFTRPQGFPACLLPSNPSTCFP